MKKGKHLLVISALASILLSSCSSQASNDVYGVEAGTGAGDYLISSSMTLAKGVIQAATLDETYSVMAWAEINSSSKLPKLDVVTKSDYEGFTRDITYAQYIRIGDLKFEGTLRDPESERSFVRRGEYVKYKCTSIVISEDDVLADLSNYLGIATSGIYNYGNNTKWYYDSIINGDYAVLDGLNGEDVTGLKNNFPNGEVLRSKNDSEWKKSIDALLNFLIGRKLNYKQLIMDEEQTQYNSLKKGPNANWMYNPNFINGDYDEGEGDWVEITDCKTSVISEAALDKYLTTLNIAYAASEYNSMR